MGCAPSKGNNFGTLRKGRMLPPSPLEVPRERLPEEGSNCPLPGSVDWDAKGKKAAGQSQNLQQEVSLPTQKTFVPDFTPEAVNMDVAKSQGLDTQAQRKEKAAQKPSGADKKLGKKPKKNTRSVKTVKKKEKDTEKSLNEQKVDFPEPLVRAHQAAYAFLNPSIVKYDCLVELLEQATQTQVLLQPMVAFMALRYEEIIQGLEEMADDGEKVFKEFGEHLAWPSQMKNLSTSAVKSGSANGEPPPDLLQQLLQYTTQRMRNVSHCVCGLGESALEEAVDYFASVSELLEEKLKAKRAAETRLMHLLCRIEMASIRKPRPEDSALFSEDSGIGGESESLAGSEKQHRPESCGSIGTNRTMSASPLRCDSSNIRQKSSRKITTNQLSPSVSLTSLNSLESSCTVMANELRDSILGALSGEDDDIEEAEETKHKVMFCRPRSVSVDRDHSRRIAPKRFENPHNMEVTLKMKNAISGRIQFTNSKVANSPKKNRQQWSDDKEQTPKRPQTAKAVVKKPAVTKERRSQSAESLRSKGEDPTLLELERTQKDLNHKLQKMSKNKAVSSIKTPPKQSHRTPIIQSPKRIRKNTSNFEGTVNKSGPANNHNKKHEEVNYVQEDKPVENSANDVNDIKLNTLPTPPSSPRPSSRICRGRNSVKKLIDTFSQGIEEREGPKVLGPLRGVKKCGVPVMPGLGNVEAVLSSGITSCRPETDFGKTDFLDLDSLPPPPMEVLMDKSFESARNLSGVSDDGLTKVSKSPLLKRVMVSQRLKASVQSVTVLPSKGGMIPASKSDSVKEDRDETPAPPKLSQTEPPQKENNAIHQQTNLRNSHAEKPASYKSPETSTSGDKCSEGKENPLTSVPGPNTTRFALSLSTIKGQSPATPPVKSRMLPSTPSTPNLLHRRLPSPSNLRRQPSPSSSSGSSSGSSPTSSTTTRRLPNTPVAKQNVLNSKSVSSYPFKAPSPPASPKLHRWSRENSREDLTYKKNNARSVFCPASPSLFEAPPCPVPTPPEAWTSSRVSFLSRMWGGPGRFPSNVQRSRTQVKRTQSDRRPSLNLPPQSPVVSFAEICGSEPLIYSQGLDDEPSLEEDLWGSQSELCTTLRSASHPDLCVVGQSLHMD